jgi:hypothetical protein
MIVSVVSFASYWSLPRSLLILERTSGIHACAEFRTSAEVDWTQDRAPWSSQVVILLLTNTLVSISNTTGLDSRPSPLVVSSRKLPVEGTARRGLYSKQTL